MGQRVSASSRLLGRVLDFCVILLSFQCTYFIISPLLHHAIFRSHGRTYYETFLAMMICWVLSIVFVGEYPVRRLNPFVREVSAVIRINLVGALGFAFVSYALRLELSRMFLAISIIDITVLMLCVRLLLRVALELARANGRNTRTRLIIGSTPSTHDYLNRTIGHPELGLRVIGYLDDQPNGLDADYLGRIEELRNVLKEHRVDAVVLGLVVSHPAFELVIRECELQGVQVELMLDSISSRIANSTLVDGAGGVPFLVIAQTPHTSEQLLLKRATDLLVSWIALVILSPVMLVIAVLIKLDDRGPVFFKQARSGLNGKTFTMYKFRSMRTDAEAIRHKLLHLNEMDGPVFKIKNDPRITRIGRFLRKTSLDELPQFFNVLRGEMSLVGPRPPLPSEVNQYDPQHRRRLSVKPGLTCLWQISGRNEINFQEWVDLDLAYIDNWSYIGDLKIIAKTIPAVLRRRGAS
ncbi:sugar transferase [Alicyclobacillus acidiphilus]|uniref:sugar transferase n=1 Tax=Alicyclobacillus acidiphilus TaxID=182455 RepID=UPI000835C672|nr:sugar transferase [Alicyclobacillus acidiphilus]